MESFSSSSFVEEESPNSSSSSVSPSLRRARTKKLGKKRLSLINPLFVPLVNKDLLLFGPHSLIRRLNSYYSLYADTQENQGFTSVIEEKITENENDPLLKKDSVIACTQEELQEIIENPEKHFEIETEKGMSGNASGSLGNLEIGRNQEWVKNYEKLLWQFCDGDGVESSPDLTNSTSSPCFSFPNDMNLLSDEQGFGFDLFSMQGINEELKKEIEEDDKLYDNSELRFNVIPTPRSHSFEYFRRNQAGNSIMPREINLKEIGIKETPRQTDCSQVFSKMSTKEGLEIILLEETE